MWDDRPLEVARLHWGRITFVPGLQVRVRMGRVSNFLLDREGNHYAEGGFVVGRIRWNPELHFRRGLRFVGALDLVNGRWAPRDSPDPIIDELLERGQAPTGGVVQPITLRELYLEARIRQTRVLLGQQAVSWGQGIVVNDGDHVDRFGDLRFGDDGPGDRYERFMIVVRPLSLVHGPAADLTLAFGGDLVAYDESADLGAGDLAGQAFVRVGWDPTDVPERSLGIYLVYRNQRNQDDDDATAGDNRQELGWIDVAGQGVVWLGRRLQLLGGFEGALVLGRSSFLRGEYPEHRVLQGGGVLRAFLGDDERWLVGFEAGYASGDPDPNDEWLNGFAFDQGAGVGLVLFPQVLGWRSARTETLALRGDLGPVPMNGTELLPTRGAVTNAVYVQPKVRVALRDQIELWGGPLIAFAPSPIVDPYASRWTGGRPVNSVGGDGTYRDYGVELDIGLRARFELRKVWFQAGVQTGVLWPGAALADVDGNAGKAIHSLQFRTELRY